MSEQTYKEDDMVEVHGERDGWTFARIVDGDDKLGYRVCYPPSNVLRVFRWPLDRIRKTT